ncbi:response regulator [Thalassobellus citreus]|uniref:response regulator n=1 Tax=Thalassobellus citreus TaxID=3367752 RepID=UPI00378C28C1
MREINQIVIVDDNKIDCFINQKVCSNTYNNACVKTFNCSVMALDYFKETSKVYKISPMNKSSVVLILLDINMPSINGFELLNELEKMNYFSNKEVEVYFLSSSNNESDISKALKAEFCSGYIIKPLTKEKLMSVMATENEEEYMQNNFISIKRDF